MGDPDRVRVRQLLAEIVNGPQPHEIEPLLSYVKEVRATAEKQGQLNERQMIVTYLRSGRIDGRNRPHSTSFLLEDLAHYTSEV